ncbi:hypothetical protein I302_108948 [Kwoniella bestiolae CBS 10118]|uniref:Uncharacterized protein n=1 Tax=Kwoniella bestiolae CBS 10118 TaxID=1296100 RepID=A0A1B9FUJ8_9TREE|nr:hypothetical protein I302_08090 [Kwoniella bestiolae CBS 10118]OCF22441.1 hypothetical protein I302_08090 [Kwoniella bestiolae CBS 10118]
MRTNGRIAQSLLRRSLVSSPIRPYLGPRLPPSTLRPTPQIRLYSQIIRRGPSSSSTPGHPSNTEYSDSTVYALSYISRVIRYILYGILTLGGVSLATFEGLHLYVEKVCIASPSRDGFDDPYGWVGENVGWTGGLKGGTDPRLGQKARHALRGAWICQEWGAGGSASSTLSKSNSFHPDYVAVKGMIGTSAQEEGRQTIDRGYELAEEFINLAINEARKRGLVFPPNLTSSSSTSNLPPKDHENTHGVPQGDPAVLDLLLLKAGILERINTTDSLLHAKDLYQQVLSSMNHAQDEQHLHNQARIMRLAGKIGDLSARTGYADNALRWWGWGLEKAGINMDRGNSTISEVVKEVKEESKSWFGFGGSKKPQLQPEASPVNLPPSSTTELTPAILRASISLLVSASAHLATTSSLISASSLQSQALSLIPSVSPTTTSPEASLHATWLQQRTALLKLYQASILHAQHLKSTSDGPLKLITESQSLSEQVISTLPAIPTPKSSALVGPAKLLRRDALLTGAEASYTRGVFLERSSPTLSGEDKAHTLEQAIECFERAMALNVLESGVEKKGEDELGQGEDWNKYWRGYVRVKGKLGGLVEPPAKAA